MSDKLPDFVSSYQDRHGKTRYRFRRKGLPARTLPGEPGTEQFNRAYKAAKAGEVVGKARKQTGHTLRDVWKQVKATQEWRALRPISQRNQTRIAERFLQMEVQPGASETMGDGPIEDLRRSSVKLLLNRYKHPHAAELMLRFLKKMSGVALDLEWIEADPTHRIKFRPKLKGHRAWTEQEHATFTKHWPIGTAPRLIYSLALYTGLRASDLKRLTSAFFNGSTMTLDQQKTDASLTIPLHPELRKVLMTTPRNGDIITSRYGRAYASATTLSEAFKNANRKAGLPESCRLHGLRKSAGKSLAEAQATTKQIMAILGHKSLKQAENYTREAEQKMLAEQGIRRWAKPKRASLRVVA